MKFFATLFSIVGVALLGTVAVVAQDKRELVDGINAITSASATANKTISGLTIRNFAQKGSEMASSLKDIVTVATQFNNQFGPDASAMRAAEETNTHALAERQVTPAVCDAIIPPLVMLVEVHQALLATVIGKHGLASQFFLTAPIAAALRSLEAVIDTFAYTILSLCPTDQNQLQPGFDSLQESFMDARKDYDG